MTLAGIVDHVVGVDPDRDHITAAVVCARTQGEVASESFTTTARGYGQALRWAKEHTTDGRRGLVDRILPQLWSWSDRSSCDNRRVRYRVRPPEHTTVQGRCEVGLSRRGPCRAGDSRAPALGNSALTRCTRGAPDAHHRTGQRQARAGCRDQRPQSPRRHRTRRPASTAAWATANGTGRALPATASYTATDPEHAATKLSLRSTANRVRHLTDECRELELAMIPLVRSTAPALLDEPGIGVLMAAQTLVSWSHPGRCRGEAAFARLGGVAPLQATSGQTQTRHRLSRGGDRQLNRALHTVILARANHHQQTKDYIAAGSAKARLNVKPCAAWSGTTPATYSGFLRPLQ